MQDSAHFQRLIDAAVQQAFDDARADLTMRVMQTIAPALVPPDNVQRLAAAIRTIESAHAQTDILGALLNGCADFATRCALFVARGVSAPLWQSSGFEAATVRGVSAMVANGLGATATQSLARAEGDAIEFDPHFVNAAGAPTNGKCVVLPLIVRDKVAALVYADAGTEGECDADALEILVRSAGYRIETAATRRQPAQTMAAVATGQNTSSITPSGQSGTAPAASAVVAPPTAAAHAVAAVAATPAMAPVAPVVSAPPARVETPAHAEHQSTAAPSQSHAAPTPEAAVTSAPQDEVHAKARRFAKLLVDEIKLYNQQEVTAGKQASDLYGRLREPIDKSREAYEKRYASTPAATGNYFVLELVRILADNNIALMGPNFPR